MSEVVDIVVTWPKTKPLEDYLRALREAEHAGEWINFRVPHLPATDPERCYRVYDGAVRGWVLVMECVERGEGEVSGVGRERDWPAGKYIVCEPMWKPIDPIPMRGFQSWRWFERPA